MRYCVVLLGRFPTSPGWGLKPPCVPASPPAAEVDSVNLRAGSCYRARAGRAAVVHWPHSRTLPGLYGLHWANVRRYQGSTSASVRFAQEEEEQPVLYREPGSCNLPRADHALPLGAVGEVSKRLTKGMNYFITLSGHLERYPKRQCPAPDLALFF